MPVSGKASCRVGRYQDEDIGARQLHVTPAERRARASADRGTGWDVKALELDPWSESEAPQMCSGLEQWSHPQLEGRSSERGMCGLRWWRWMARMIGGLS